MAIHSQSNGYYPQLGISQDQSHIYVSVDRCSVVGESGKRIGLQEMKRKGQKMRTVANNK